MSSARAAVEVVGDWTSARLLIRLMQAIDSPWELTEAGLVHEDTGEVCLLEMRRADPALPAAFRAGESPVFPSLTDEVLAGIDGHRSVLRVVAAEPLVGEDASAAVVRCGSGLIDAGGIALRCVQSGVAHSAAHWQLLASQLDLAADAADRRSALYQALVRPLVRTASGWETVGMGLLDLPDVCAPPDLSETAALDAMEAVVARMLAGGQPVEGGTVRPSPTAPRLRVARAPDPRPASDPRHNPVGRWALTP